MSNDFIFNLGHPPRWEPSGPSKSQRYGRQINAYLTLLSSENKEQINGHGI
jgi:hypothetical protein